MENRSEISVEQALEQLDTSLAHLEKTLQNHLQRRDKVEETLEKQSTFATLRLEKLKNEGTKKSKDLTTRVDNAIARLETLLEEEECLKSQ